MIAAIIVGGAILIGSLVLFGPIGLVFALIGAVLFGWIFSPSKNPEADKQHAREVDEAFSSLWGKK